MAVADLDGDSLLDIVSASYYDNKIAWYRNEGGGAFATQQVVSTQARGARSVAVADLDLDGLPPVFSKDVILQNPSPQVVDYFRSPIYTLPKQT